MVYLRQLVLASIVGFAAAVSSHSSQVTATDAGASCACTQLAALQSKELLLPNSTNYKAEATDYWDLRSNLSPGCIFLPSSAEEVSSAVKILVSCNAQFAVRAGGHMNVSSSWGLLQLSWTLLIIT